MKKPDLVVLIAVWEFLSAFGILLFIGAVASAYLAATPWMWGNWTWDGMMWDVPRTGGIIFFVLGFVLLLMVAYFVLALMGGVGLLKGREWGRVLSIVQAALSLFWFPVGTVIGILILIYLIKPEVREYFSPES